MNPSQPLIYTKPEAPSWTTIPVELPFACAKGVVPDLKPGLHIVCGPHGCGKSTFALQLAVDMALKAASVRVILPEIPPSEGALRLAGICLGRPWWRVQDSPLAAEQGLDRLSGSRLDMLAMGQFDGDNESIWSSGGSYSAQLIVFDHISESTALQIAKESKLRGVVVIATIPSKTPRSSVEQGCLGALSVGATDALLAASETTFRLSAPENGAIECDVPRVRRGVPCTLNLRLENGIFRDEEELQLELKDVDGAQ